MRETSAGFTLVELMVTLVIAVILMTVAVPSMMSFYEASRANSEISRIEETLRFARNHAISYGANVIVKPASESNWKSGIRVIMSNNGTIETIRVVEGINSNDTILSNREFVVFLPDGLVGMDAIFTYCPNGSGDESKSIQVSISGLVKTLPNGLTCS